MRNKKNDNSTKNAFSDIYKLVAETLTQSNIFITKQNNKENKGNQQFWRLGSRSRSDFKRLKPARFLASQQKCLLFSTLFSTATHAATKKIWQHFPALTVSLSPTIALPLTQTQAFKPSRKFPAEKSKKIHQSDRKCFMENKNKFKTGKDLHFLFSCDYRICTQPQIHTHTAMLKRRSEKQHKHTRKQVTLV